jgi:hypothetical protein
MGQGNCYIYDKCCFILSMSTVSGVLKSTVVSVVIDVFISYDRHVSLLLLDMLAYYYL